MNNCPWCGSKAIEMTTFDDLAGADKRRVYICNGPVCHEWRDGDGPEPDQPPVIILASS